MRQDQRSLEPAPKRKTRKAASVRSDLDAATEIANQAGLIGLILAALFILIASFRGAHWKLREDENKALSKSTALVANSLIPEKYHQVYDENLKRWSPLSAFALDCYAIIGRRIREDKLVAAQAKAHAAGVAHGGGNGRGVDGIHQPVGVETGNRRQDIAEAVPTV